MCNKDSAIKTSAVGFVADYVAGSCNSYDEIISVFIESIKEIYGISLTREVAEKIIDAEIEDNGTFLCTECSWWCFDHEISFEDSTKCADCNPENEDDY